MVEPGMTDLDRAIAAAREALKVKSHPLDSRVTKTLRDLLAALDAARGQAVATVTSSTPAMTFSVVTPGFPDGTKLYAAPPAAPVVMLPYGWHIVPRQLPDEVLVDTGCIDGYDGQRGDAEHRAWWESAIDSLAARVPCPVLTYTQAPPAAAVPAANVTPMRQPRADLARLVESINAAVYANGDGLSVTEAIGALELAKLELLKEREQ